MITLLSVMLLLGALPMTPCDVTVTVDDYFDSSDENELSDSRHQQVHGIMRMHSANASMVADRTVQSKVRDDATEHGFVLVPSVDAMRQRRRRYGCQGCDGDGYEISLAKAKTRGRVRRRREQEITQQAKGAQAANHTCVAEQRQDSQKHAANDGDWSDLNGNSMIDFRRDCGTIFVLCAEDTVRKPAIQKIEQAEEQIGERGARTAVELLFGRVLTGPARPPEAATAQNSFASHETVTINRKPFVIAVGHRLLLGEETLQIGTKLLRTYSLSGTSSGNGIANIDKEKRAEEGKKKKMAPITPVTSRKTDGFPARYKLALVQHNNVSRSHGNIST
ncbi:unnamed protein product [Polarella glacialis]|uniref:Uncharacterized protein n=1 Tax=Polarella glacialis TaxID=89957 RepID=A0A813EX44_POLGL|nr:unnamed protein product [Polarella glacialis]CAE8717577.1 unnamed protein product [Polarella glacialis]